jgi:hypothetical protein
MKHQQLVRASINCSVGSHQLPRFLQGAETTRSAIIIKTTTTR